MRIFAVTVLTLGGCIPFQNDCAPLSGKAGIAVAALSAAAWIGDAVIQSQRPEAEDEDDLRRPPPSGIRDAWRGSALACKQGRSLHLRCVTAVSGRLCFWETDEGTPYDCPDDTCSTIPADLAAWCY